MIESNKEAYYLGLRRTQGTLAHDAPDFEPWLLFFLRSLKKQKDRLAEKLERDISVEDLHAVALKILLEARRVGQITTGEAERLTAVPRPTVKIRLAELVRRGLLQRHGKGRGSWYEPASTKTER